jgi:aspartokinase
VAIVVQKYGGTSVAGPEEIKRVARRIVETADAGNRVCVVVSAMGDTTDRLIDLAHEVSPDRRVDRPNLPSFGGAEVELNGSLRDVATHNQAVTASAPFATSDLGGVESSQ